MNYKEQLRIALNVYWRTASYQDISTLERQYYLDMYQKALDTYQNLLALEAFEYERA